MNGLVVCEVSQKIRPTGQTKHRCQGEEDTLCAVWLASWTGKKEFSAKKKIVRGISPLGGGTG